MWATTVGAGVLQKRIAHGTPPTEANDTYLLEELLRKVGVASRATNRKRLPEENYVVSTPFRVPLL
jgi:hypothetical protein